MVVLVSVVALGSLVVLVSVILLVSMLSLGFLVGLVPMAGLGRQACFFPKVEALITCWPNVMRKQ